ncbi:hypothetical protein PTKIN_Ptkin14bG0046800 [Pterospermum kingtungense]
MLSFPSVSSSSSSSSSISGHKYDVFLSFRGWCLEELTEIVKQKKERAHKVFPIFYEVDPSHLRKQTGKVREAFDQHEERYNEDKDKTRRWRTALTQVANIAGWNSKNKPESEFIENIVEKIYSVVPRELIRPLIPSKDFMPSKSSNLTFNEIIKALDSDGVNMIGLYGMPGVGKTTLAQQFGTSTIEGKAEELWRRLKVVNKILIIIDDVWNEFELRIIGIPFGVEHKGCKILLTMRLQQVCVRMDCQEKFQLGILSESEAWALFRDKAGLKDVSSALNEVAKEVASECKGLPLAIVTIGKALKGERLDGWIAANKRFKNSRHLDNEDVCEVLYNCLLLSYDYLKGDNIRSCFLLCSLFPEDFDIGLESLVCLELVLDYFLIFI